MGKVTEIDRMPALGPWVRNLRLYLKVTQKDIARLAEVKVKDIVLLEKNALLSSEIRTRILKELHKIRVQNWNLLTNC